MLTFMLLSAAASIPIHVGQFDPANFANAQKVERRMPQYDLVRRVERILGRKQCTLAGQNKARFDIVVPYAVKMDGSGAATQVVVKEIGCPQIERLVGEVASELSKAGDFTAKHQDGTRWYVSEVYFTKVNLEATRSTEDQDKVVCQRPHDAMGTRIVKARVCKTVAEWKVFNADREQMKRDLQNLPDPKSF